MYNKIINIINILLEDPANQYVFDSEDEFKDFYYFLTGFLTHYSYLKNKYNIHQSDIKKINDIYTYSATERTKILNNWKTFLTSNYAG